MLAKDLRRGHDHRVVAEFHKKSRSFYPLVDPPSKKQNATKKMTHPIQLPHLINQLNFNYTYLLNLVSDIEEEAMTHTPNKGLENHPTFTIGHIITAYGLTIKKLGGKYNIKKEWDEIFRRNGPGDPRLPIKEKDRYPTKEVLLLELKNQHETMLNYLNKTTNEKLNEEVTWRFSNHFPKTIDFLYFMLVTHYSMHISQLAAWRRAMNLPSSLARL